MYLFLTHTDTPYRMYHERRAFADPCLHLNASVCPLYTDVTAVLAFWQDKRLTDEESWQAYLSMRRDTSAKLLDAPRNFHPVFALEDARLLGEKPEERLSLLYADGIRILTPLWRGETRVGGGYDTQLPLTDYGRCLIRAACRCGMIPDISHASRESARDILHIASSLSMPVCASHSCFAGVCPHPRNLTDEEAKEIRQSGGFIGLSFVPAHVGGAKNTDTLLSHIFYADALGVTDCLSLGTDFDGTDELIAGISSAVDLPSLADSLIDAGCSVSDTQDIFFGNAERSLSPLLS